MKNKNYVIVIVGFIIIFTSFFLFSGLKLIKNKNQDNVLVVSNEAVFRNVGNNWKNISNKANFIDYNWSLFNTYVDNEYFGKYNMVYSDKWYLFNSDKSAVNYNGNLLAHTDKIDVVDFNINTIDDNDKYVNEILNKYKISNRNFTSNYYVDVDLDKDNNLDRIYVISNIFPIDPTNSNEFYGIIFAVKNGKILEIYKDIGVKDNIYSGCKPFVSNIANVDLSKNYELILGCANYSDGKISYKLYNLDNNRFNLLVSN